MAVATQGSKTVKKASSSSTAKKSASSKPAASHPPYIQMITDAVVALKERTGSSLPAIAKHIEEEQKIKDLPPNFKKLLYTQIKRFVASGKLVKVKNSFKLPPTSKPKVVEKKPKAAPKAAKPAAADKEKKKKPAAKPKAAAAPKPKAAKKVKPPVKAKKPKSIKSPAKKRAAPAAVKKAAPAAKKAKK